jgi:hypothetical protein
MAPWQYKAFLGASLFVSMPGCNDAKRCFSISDSCHSSQTKPIKAILDPRWTDWNNAEASVYNIHLREISFDKTPVESFVDSINYALQIASSNTIPLRFKVDNTRTKVTKIGCNISYAHFIDNLVVQVLSWYSPSPSFAPATPLITLRGNQLLLSDAMNYLLPSIYPLRFWFEGNEVLIRDTPPRLECHCYLLSPDIVINVETNVDIFIEGSLDVPLKRLSMAFIPGTSTLVYVGTPCEQNEFQQALHDLQEQTREGGIIQKTTIIVPTGEEDALF